MIALPLFELAGVLVRVDHVASFIVNANHSIIALEIEPAEDSDMKARLVKFGEIEVEGKRYTHDVVIDGGKVRKRKKGPSKQFRETFGHTPLSAGEEIPWGGKRLIVGTGAHGALPLMDEVLAEAKRRCCHCFARASSPLFWPDARKRLT